MADTIHNSLFFRKNNNLALRDGFSSLSKYNHAQEGEVVDTILGSSSFRLVFRIRIRIRSDPYHLAGFGSGSSSENIDLDPGTKKKL